MGTETISKHDVLAYILAHNNNGKDIKNELKCLGTKYKSEVDELISDDQRSLILRCLKEELLA